MSNIFERFWNFIQNLFNSLEAEWHKLEPHVKNALQWASEAVAVITTNVDATPQFLLDLIQNALPNADIEEIKKAIHEVASKISGLEDIPQDDIYTTLAEVQKYLNQFEGQKWAAEVSTFAQKVAQILAPGATFAQLLTFMEYVYQRIVKK